MIPMMTKEEFEKAFEVCTSADTNCAYCPLSKKIYRCGGYFARYIKENEPALSANSTSSEVVSKDTDSTHLDDSTKEQICQAYETADKACTDILLIYDEMSECEQRAFDIGEVYGKICSTRDKLENLRGAN
ncbi:hypothetical protein [uncultured Ruminococcus sp.]|uniref:hypothetical protein n=1 Tax=uncultured Ruminococcus sp. TaxID=165186 RepID=UPI00204B0B12|nr:hypothetical protein [uncultured Ruminococcus sp.]DAL79707.1 MAG TPA: hypothetical protein [Caudoviricetes sp.]